MKNTAYLFVVVLFASIVASCGPSAEEIQAEESRKQDSLRLKALEDSIANAQAQQKLVDSIAAATAAALQDSLAKAQEAEAAAAAEKSKASSAKPAPKKNPEQKKQEQEIKEVKDATRGRG